MARSRPPLILIPPSEGKAAGGDGPPWSPGSLVAPELDDRRCAVAGALARVSGPSRSVASRAKLFGVKGAALAAACDANVHLLEAPTAPAIERYTGVLYGELAYRTLRPAHRRRVDAQVRILSGLWGVLRPTDLIPDYKLKMGATLPGVKATSVAALAALPPIRKVSTWWRPAVSRVLDEAAAGRVVWNLLPQEHAAAWQPDEAAAPPSAVLSVRFLDEVVRAGGPELVAVNHWNKLLKGALVRHVVATQLADVAGLADFVSPQGYRFVPELTTRSADGRTQVASLVKPAR